MVDDDYEKIKREMIIRFLENKIVSFTRKDKNSNLVSRKVPKPSCLNNLQFRGKSFKRWRGYPKFLDKKVRRLKQVHWGWHNLRHRYASKLSKEGKPVNDVVGVFKNTELFTIIALIHFSHSLARK